MKVYPVGIQRCIFYLSTRFFVHVQIIVKGTYRMLVFVFSSIQVLTFQFLAIFLGSVSCI